MSSYIEHPIADRPDRPTVRRSSTPALRAWLGQLWAGGPASGCAATLQRERVLPTGNAHLVFRLAGPTLRLFGSAEDVGGRTIGHCIVGGAREVAYLRALDSPAWSVGAELRPGAALALLGVPAPALAHSHWSLEDLWGADAARIRDRLMQCTDAHVQLGLLEEELLRRLSGEHGLHPAVVLGIVRLRAGCQVREVVRESGYSHRRFVTLFREAVGLSPKAWSRVQRFRRVLDGLAAFPDGRLVAAAAAADYFDQPHFNREFRQIAGMTPADYRRLRPVHPNHVPLAS